MQIPVQPTIRPEAELETRIVAALAHAFPNIPPERLIQQRRFTVRLGHETREFDSAAQWEKTGRADILILYEGRALAVIEVKREDLPITEADHQQAQSYASQMTPRPPLVIVTNGTETRIYDGNTGQPWLAENDAAQAVARLFANAAKIAASEMRWATEALMGRAIGIWPSIVRACTGRLIDAMTDPPGKSGRPFARDLLFPRAAVIDAAKALGSPAAFVVVDGPPAAGKTSLLRELAIGAAAPHEMAVLLLRATGPGLFQSLANLFASELEWNLSADDARQWLRRLSDGSSGPTLVVAIDGVEPHSAMAADLEELAGMRLGSRLKVVLTTDAPDGLTKAPNGRTDTALGERASRVGVGPLGLEEFKGAREALAGVRILMPAGAEYAVDYRAPWILRTIYDAAARSPNFADGQHMLYLPASLGLELVGAARKAYGGDTDLLRGYRLLARDAVADDVTPTAELALAITDGFAIRQDCLSARSREVLGDLKSAGWARTTRIAGREDVVLPTVPALYLAEYADAFGEELASRQEAQPWAAGEWLGRRLEGVYLGDLIGAQAIRSMAEKTGEFREGVIGGLLSIEPSERLVENALFATPKPDGELQYVKIEGGKAWRSNRRGDKLGGEIELGAERSRVCADVTAWMILGQFARLPTAIVGDDEARVDATVLYKIGQCAFPLLRASEEGLSHLEHDLGALGQVLCPEVGPIEPTTQAIADMLSRPWAGAESWIDAVLDSGSLPLIHRVLIALQTVEARQIADISERAARSLRNRVRPKVRALLDEHRKS